MMPSMFTNSRRRKAEVVKNPDRIKAYNMADVINPPTISVMDLLSPYSNPSIYR